MIGGTSLASGAPAGGRDWSKEAVRSQEMAGGLPTSKVGKLTEFSPTDL